MVEKITYKGPTKYISRDIAPASVKETCCRPLTKPKPFINTDFYSERYFKYTKILVSFLTSESIIIEINNIVYISQNKPRILVARSKIAFIRFYMGRFPIHEYINLLQLT